MNSTVTTKANHCSTTSAKTVGNLPAVFLLPPLSVNAFPWGKAFTLHRHYHG